MATRFNHMGVAPARNKRKGIPMRSPCQRDMIEAPGVVFRFPDKISTSTSSDHINHHPSSQVSTIDILPSSAGLPSGLGAKTAAAVIAAAAAVSQSSSESSESRNNNSTADNTAHTIATTAAAGTGDGASDVADITATALSTAGTLTQPKQQQQQAQDQDQGQRQEVRAEEGGRMQSTPFPDTASSNSASTADSGKGDSDRDGVDAQALDSANSTPLLKPATGAASISAGAIPIHRSASNVLHYPELLSDLRDKLIQIHQISGHGSNHNSSGVESDGNHNSNAATNGSVPRRARERRGGRGGSSGTFGERETPGRRGRHYYASVGARRSGLRGDSSHGSNASASSPGPDSAIALESLSAAGKTANVSFHRRHSIGTIQSQAEDDEVVDVEDDGDDEDDDDEGPLASQQYALPAQFRHNDGHFKQHQARRPHGGQVGAAAASARRHHLGAGEALASETYAGAPGSAKRKRDSTSASADRRSKSPSALHAKRAALAQQHQHQQQHHRHQSPAAAGSGRRSCASCGANSTPCWRPGLIDKVTLCNQCGLRYKKGKVYCPTCSYVPTKTEIATGGALECKRCASRIVQRQSPSPSSRASASPTPGP
ncbi:DNA-binding transcription repressor [Coemansia sp. RSA 1939]|nr:DNA-binding transcription repressor [Coemansia sp. RSA 1939]